MNKLADHDFKKLYQTERNARSKVRFLALHHLQQGKSNEEVCDMVCISIPTLKSWLSWYDIGGIERLRDKIKGRGVKTKISLTKEDLQAAILKLQSDRNGGRVIGSDIRQWLKDTYQVEYHHDYIYTLLKRLGLSWVSSRSIHPNTDVTAQETFKKTSVPKY